MAQQCRILVDTETNICQDFFDQSFPLNNPDSGAEILARVSKRRLHGGLSDGIDLVEIDNGCLSLSVLPSRGMGIWRGRCGDVELKWDSPVPGPVHPSFVPVTDPGGTGWLEGFDEWLVRCGLESNGSPDFDENGALRYPLHGRIANLPAQYLDLSTNHETGEITLSGKVVEAKLFFKSLELHSSLTSYAGSSAFIVRDTITNLSAEPGEFQLLYHINTGMPFAAPGSRVVLAFDRMAPRTDVAVEDLPQWNRLGPETPGSAEVVYFFEPAAQKDGTCRALLVNPRGDRALRLGFNRNSFPYFCLWKSRLSNRDGYVCGLEPAVNFPNPRSFEKAQGRVVSLAPGESRSFELCFEILQDAEAVRQAEEEINAVPAARVIEAAPRPEWTP